MLSIQNMHGEVTDFDWMLHQTMLTTSQGITLDMHDVWIPNNEVMPTIACSLTKGCNKHWSTSDIAYTKLKKTIFVLESYFMSPHNINTLSTHTYHIFMWLFVHNWFCWAFDLVLLVVQIWSLSNMFVYKNEGRARSFI